MARILKTVPSIAGTCAGRHEPEDGHPQVWHERDWQQWVLSRYEAQGLTAEEARLATSGLNARLDHEPYWVGVLCDLDGQPHRHCIVPDHKGGFTESEIPVWRHSESVAAELLEQWQQSAAKHTAKHTA